MPSGRELCKQVTQRFARCVLIKNHFVIFLDDAGVNVYNRNVTNK